MAKPKPSETKSFQTSANIVCAFVKTIPEFNFDVTKMNLVDVRLYNALFNNDEQQQILHYYLAKMLIKWDMHDYCKQATE